MLSCPLKLSASQLPINPMPRTILPKFAYVIEQTTYLHSCAYLVRSLCPCAGRVRFSSFTAQKDIYPRQIIRSCKGLNSDRLRVDNCSQESVDNEDDKEIQRRIKIGRGNKGKVPWNKGRTHSEETRERIRRRTKEALKDPKVRKKMSEAPRALSNQTKAKIRTSLTSLWGTRLKWKRSREKFLQSWAESIVTAAKKGGIGEQELDWDSYDKLKQEIALLQTELAAEKAKAKEMARVRAERAAEAKAERMDRLAQKRREREENTKARGLSITKRSRKSKEEKEKMAEFQEEKLKERLLKIHKKKSAVSQVSSQHRRPWEKLDLDFTKGLRQETSLADQIRIAKNRRMEQLLDQL
ncbi:hypothetical protein PHJA_000008400 [Phtheirospermum japonicum]|uniref:Nuclease associated modular domain-containing protein n=1 Tax=Phtheirospermum japonicum TaxID=374723 RepID=A0A830B163_9LAMI|nr:hypothetical protein PHJA_000008400 [Phtheirospermum japonicum]